jgi:pyrimidine-specific ribonucleoside hydrolase
MRTRVLIDTDPGYDDAVALALVLSHPERLSVEGCVSTAGNQTLPKVTDNLNRLLSFYGRADIPVCQGSAKPLVKPLVTAAAVHGESGLDGADLPPSGIVPVAATATDFIGRIARRVPQEREDLTVGLTILTLGPLTNIAHLLMEDPSVVADIDRIVLMGGGLGTGNVTSAAEFNIYADPEAAKLVFASKIPLVMVGLDATNSALILPEEINRLRSRGKTSRMIANLFDHYCAGAIRRGVPGCRLHDPAAAAYLLDPSLFTGEDLHVQIETEGLVARGMTIADRRPFARPEPNAHVLLKVDRARLVELLLDSLAALDRMLG